jgi:hypothetical protein
MRLIPGEIVFAALGDFNGVNPETALTNIVKWIHETTHSDLA